MKNKKMIFECPDCGSGKGLFMPATVNVEINKAELTSNDVFQLNATKGKVKDMRLVNARQLECGDCGCVFALEDGAKPAPKKAKKTVSKAGAKKTVVETPVDLSGKVEIKKDLPIEDEVSELDF